MNMKKDQLFQVEKTVKERSNRKWWQRAVSILSAAAVFCTTYAMILPAITWERSLVCDIPEHHHVDSCYEIVTIHGEKELICSEAEHVHGSDCYIVTDKLICGLEKSESHSHSEACYEKELVCQIPEHTHSDSCRAEAEPREEKVLVCGLEEHEHSAACFDAPPTEDDGYYCGKIEHTHSEEQNCYFYDGSLRCTIPEHQHTLACQSNPKANVVLVGRTIKSIPASDGAIAVVTGKIPDGAVVKMEAVTLSDEQLIEYFGEEKATVMSDYVAYDITILVNGEEWQPDSSVSVTIKQPDIQISESQRLEVAHVDSATNEVSVVNSELNENGDIKLSADGFSLYIAYTVDFHYGERTFSINGGSSVMLSGVFMQLDIEEDAADVTDVSFSDSALFKAEVVENDWKLTSLASFDTEVTLTVTFSSGKSIDVLLTDPPEDMSAEPGLIKIKLNIKNWDNADEALPYVTMGINRRGTYGSRDDLIMLTSDSNGVAYAEIPYGVLGTRAFIAGDYDVFSTTNPSKNYIRFDMDPRTTGYSINVSQNGKIRNAITLVNAEKDHRNDTGNTSVYYDNFYFNADMPENGAVVEFDVFLKRSASGNHTVSFDTSTIANAADFNPITVANGSSLTSSLPTPINKTNEDYPFLGWSYEGADFDPETKIYHDITLSPKWEGEGIIHFKVYMWDHDYYVSHGETGTTDHRADGQTKIPIDGVRMVLKSYPGDSNPSEGTYSSPDWNLSWNGIIEDYRKIPVGRPGGSGTALEGVTVHYNAETGAFEGDYVITNEQLQYLRPGYVIDTDPDSNVLAEYNRAVTDPNYAVGAGISYHNYTGPTTFGTEITAFDWDWYVAGEDSAGAGNTGVRVIPECKRRGGTIPNGTNNNDVAQISQDMIDNGFEFTFVCYLVPAVVVQFDTDGGVLDCPAQKFKPHNSLPIDQQNFIATDPGTPVKDDLSFLGWYEVLGQDEDGNDILADTPWNFSTQLSHSMTLKAKYAKIFDKVVDSDEIGGSVQYGEIVPYKITGYVPDTTGYSKYIYEIQDGFGGGEFVDGSLSVKIGGTPVTIDGTDVSVEYDGINGGISTKPDLTLDIYTKQYRTTSFTLTIDMTKYQDRLGQPVTVQYSVLNNGYSLNYLSNNASLWCSYDPAHVTWTKQVAKVGIKLNTYNITPKKVAEDGETLLSGAEFVLKNSDGKYYACDWSDDFYTVVFWVDSIEDAMVATSDATNHLLCDYRFIGLKAGEYELVEIKAPAGYKLSEEPVTVTFSDGEFIVDDSLTEWVHYPSVSKAYYPPQVIVDDPEENLTSFYWHEIYYPAVIVTNEPLPIFDKIVDSDDICSVEWGEIVPYKITGFVPDTTGYSSYVYRIKDQISGGQLCSEITVKLGDRTLTAGEDYTITIGGYIYNIYTADNTVYSVHVEQDANKEFTIEFNMLDYQYHVGEMITVTYSAKVDLTSNGGITNIAKLEHSYDPSRPDKVDDFTIREILPSLFFNVFKTAEDGTTPLEGAKFVLQNSEGQYYRPSTDPFDPYIWVDDFEDAMILTTGSDGYGDKTFLGLKSGTEYQLKEIKAPAGYVASEETVIVTFEDGEREIDDWGSTLIRSYEYGKGYYDGTEIIDIVQYETRKKPVIVINEPFEGGPILPETGGIGTTIFYALGTLLITGSIMCGCRLRRKGERRAV